MRRWDARHDAGQSRLIRYHRRYYCNSHSIALARLYFSLPAQVTCYVDDGASFLTRSERAYDAIIIDTSTEERVPHHLCSVEFFQLVRERLASAGCVLLNVLLQHGSDLSADVVAGRMAHAGFDVPVLMSRGPAKGNAIVMGGAVAELRRPTLLMKPDVLEEEIAAELEGMHFRGGRRLWNSRTAPQRKPAQSP